MAALTTKQQSIEVTEVTDMIVTEIVQDNDGAYVREIRVFVAAEAPATGQVQMFVLRTKGATRSALEITSPAAQF